MDLWGAFLDCMQCLAENGEYFAHPSFPKTAIFDSIQRKQLENNPK